MPIDSPPDEVPTTGDIDVARGEVELAELGVRFDEAIHPLNAVEAYERPAADARTAEPLGAALQNERNASVGEHLRAIGETPLSSEAMVAAVQEIASGERLGELASNARGVVLLPKGQGEAHIYIRGRLYTDNNGDERAMMQKIQERLRRTVSARDQFYRGGREDAYLEYDADNVLKVSRWQLEKDLRWLHDDKRIGPDVPDKRLQYFEGYANALTDIVMLSNRKRESEFLHNTPSVLTDQKTLETYCRDPDAIKGAGKFALLLAVGALATLWAIKDIRGKTFSFATLILLGVVLFLTQTGSKFNFLGSKEFSDVTKRLSPTEIKKLMTLSRNSVRYNHLMSILESYAKTGIPREELHRLTDPKKKVWNAAEKKYELKSDPARKIDADIAELFVGLPGSHQTLLNGLRTAERSPEGKQATLDFAKANFESGGTAREELASLTRTPTHVKSSDEVKTPAPDEEVHP